MACWGKSKRGPGRPEVSAAVRALIRKMCLANPIWRASRIHGELLKLGIQVSETTVAKYMPRNRRPPSETWRAFLKNHAQQLVSVDFFVAPTLSFRSSLRKILRSYFRCYERSRTHVALGKDSPQAKTVHPPNWGKWWTCRKSMACTIGTSAAPPEFLLALWVEGFALVRLLLTGNSLCGLIHSQH